MMHHQMMLRSAQAVLCLLMLAGCSGQQRAANWLNTIPGAAEKNAHFVAANAVDDTDKNNNGVQDWREKGKR